MQFYEAYYGAHYSWNSWNTPGIPGILLELKVSSFRTPENSLEDSKFSCTPGKLLDFGRNCFHFYKQTKTCRRI